MVSGLGKTFGFQSTERGPLTLNRSDLIAVHPSLDLSYLRTGYFDVAELGQWTTATAELDLENVSLRQSWVRSIEIEVLDDSLQDAPTPVGTLALERRLDKQLNRQLGIIQLETPLRRGERYRASVTELPSESPKIASVPSLYVQVGEAILANREPFERLISAANNRYSGEDPFIRAQTIALLLQQRCRYSLQEPRGPHDYSLLNFLSGDRQGFCMHFASATAIALRLAGVPCRIAVGLYGGREAPDGSPARIFGADHAHAWVEIPTTNHGWWIIDPSPPLSTNFGPRWPAQDSDDWWRQDSSQQEDPSEDPLAILANPTAHFEYWLPLAFLLLLPWLLRLVRSKRAGKRIRGRELAKRKAHQARRKLQTLLRLLAKQGLSNRHQCLEGYLRTLGDRNAPHLDLLERAFNAYQEVRFGDQVFGHDRQAILDAAIHAVSNLAASQRNQTQPATI